MGSIQNLIVPFLFFSLLFGLQNLWFSGNLNAQNKTEDITSLTDAQALLNVTNDATIKMQNQSSSGSLQIFDQFAVFLGVFKSAGQYFVLQASIGTLVYSLAPMLSPVFSQEIGFISAFILIFLGFKFVMQFIKLLRGVEP